MTEALRYIKGELNRGNSQFRVPARILQKEDSPLWQNGALVFRGAYLRKVRCPECGALVDVDRVVDEAGEPHYSMLCLDCDALEVRPVPPADVELLEFQIRAFTLYVNDRSVSGEYVEAAAACLPLKSESDASRGQNAQATNPGRTGLVKKRPIARSAFAGLFFGNIKIDADGTRIHIGKHWLKFSGERQWQVIDALFKAWMNGFGKAEIGAKAEIEKVFGSRRGRYFLSFVHFETRDEAGLAKKQGNCRFTGNAWFDRKKIYPEKFTLKKE